MSNVSPLIQFVLVSLIMLAPTAAAKAEIRSTTVAVDGMSCPFCAFGVEKRLRKVDGVGRVLVSTREGAATLIAGKGKSIDVGQVPDAVRKAGFTPGAIRISVVGDLRVEGSNRLLLHVAGTSLVLTVNAATGAMEARLRSFAGDGTLIQITGELGGSGERLSIMPATVEEVPGV